MDEGINFCVKQNIQNCAPSFEHVDIGHKAKN